MVSLKSAAEPALAAETSSITPESKMEEMVGAIPALTAMLSGEAQCMVASLPGTIPYLQSRRVRALGVTSAQRAPTTPAIPTMIEAGI